MTYTLTEDDLPYLQAILEKLGVDEESRATLLRSIEIVSEEKVAATDHVEVDLGGQDHAEYLARIVCDLISGMQAPPDPAPSSPAGKGSGAAPEAGGSGATRWIPGHQHHDSMPEPGGGVGGGIGGGGSPGWGGSGTKIVMEMVKEVVKSWTASDTKAPKSPNKKQKVIHHPGKQWLDPGWHERP